MVWDYNEDGFNAVQPGVKIIGFSEQHWLKQPHKDLGTSPKSPITRGGLPCGSLGFQSSQNFTVAALSQRAQQNPCRCGPYIINTS